MAFVSTSYFGLDYLYLHYRFQISSTELNESKSYLTLSKVVLDSIPLEEAILS